MEMPTPESLQRLAFIRALYLRAVDTSQEPEPLGAMSLLGFQDAADSFLHLAAQHLNANLPRDVSFEGYWSPIDDKLPDGVTLAERVAMRGVNKARVALKHHGVIPARLSIEGYRASTTAFLEGNTPAVFEGVEFRDLEMAQLITYPKTREMLRLSSKFAEKGDILNPSDTSRSIPYHDVGGITGSVKAQRALSKMHLCGTWIDVPVDFVWGQSPQLLGREGAFDALNIAFVHRFSALLAATS